MAETEVKVWISGDHYRIAILGKINLCRNSLRLSTRFGSHSVRFNPRASRDDKCEPDPPRLARSRLTLAPSAVSVSFKKVQPQSAPPDCGFSTSATPKSFGAVGPAGIPSYYYKIVMIIKLNLSVGFGLGQLRRYPYNYNIVITVIAFKPE